ncbi:MAG: hypothetical protein Kow00124_05080 [Anaerolineae bacterium]
MSTTPSNSTNSQPAGSEAQKAFGIIGIVIVVILLALIAGAVLLALNAKTTAPGVEIVRDLLIIFLTLEMIIIGAALTVLVVQIARFINLMNNEVQPLVETTRETLQTVRGTAAFMSKHLAEPVMQANSVLSGLAKVARDVDAIGKVVGIATATVVSGASAADGTDTADAPASAGQQGTPPPPGPAERAENAQVSEK